MSVAAVTEPATPEIETEADESESAAEPIDPSPSRDVRAALHRAAGSSSEPDTHWETPDAVRRLYFFDPRRPETSGAVDVSDGTDSMTRYVKMDLWVPASCAAEVIRFVSRFHSGGAQRMPVALANGAGASAAPSPVRAPEARPAPITPPRAPEGALPTSSAFALPPPSKAAPKPAQKRSDAETKELEKLIASQKEDDED